MLVALANTFAYILYLLIIMSLSCLKLFILIYRPPQSPTIVVLNITLSFSTNILIYCGFTPYETNPMSSLKFDIILNMFKLNSNAKLNLFNAIMVENFTILNSTLYLIKMAYNFVFLALTPPNKMEGLKK